MNEISNLNLTAFKGYSVQETNSKVTNPISTDNKSFDTDFYVDAKSVNAIKANAGISTNATDITKPVSSDDYVAKLQRAGLREGTDFEVFGHPENGKTVYIKNKNGENVKTVFWFGGNDANHYEGYQNIAMQKNNTRLITEYDKNNIMNTKSVWYENANEHKNLFPEGIDLNTSSKDYIAMLDGKNIKYEKNESGANGDNSVFIVEKDSEGNPVKITDFMESSDGSRFINQSSNPDKYGTLRHEVCLVSDGDYSDITVTDYVKHLGIRG